jgi:hypothetical protein
MPMLRILLAAALALFTAPASAFNLPFAAIHAQGASGAASIGNADAGIITTESLSTVAGGTQAYVISSSQVTPNSVVFVSVQFGTSNAGTPAVTLVNTGATSLVPGSVTVRIQNIHATNAFNGSLILSVLIFN